VPFPPALSPNRVVVPLDTSTLEVLRQPLDSAQYLAIRYTDTLVAVGAVASVGTAGDSYDNALAESTIGQIKAELITRHRPWRTLDPTTCSTPTARSLTSSGSRRHRCRKPEWNRA